ncbi:uncharacterized protein [Haliotis asinina]|uniref:uncharacterized protein isoform X1 n=1 Tax=Haliotis asinina TaxID=109174 RepID=UPI0035326305
MSMSSHDYGSPLPHQATNLVPPTCGAYGSTNDDRDAVTGDGNDGQGTSFEEMGIPRRRLLRCIDGMIRRFQDAEWYEKVYLIVSTLAMMISLGLTSYRLHTVDKYDTDFLFELFVFVSTFFCCYYLVHGVLKERRYEMFILATITAIMVSYIIVNYSRGLRDTIKLARMIFSCCMAPVVVIVGLILGCKYRPSGYLICRTVGGMPELQDMCNKLFLFLDLLSFDLQLGITMALFTHVNDPDVDTLDFVVLGVGGAISIVWFALGYTSVQRESKILTYLFTVLSPLELCYVIYKITMASKHLALYPVIAPCSITTGCLAVAVRVTIISLTYLVSMNYGKGLKKKVFGRQNSEQSSAETLLR